MRAAHATADHSFAATLYAQLASQQGNLVLSPTSIRIALAMATLGARGETAEEMARALAFTGKEHHEDRENGRIVFMGRVVDPREDRTN